MTHPTNVLTRISALIGLVAFIGTSAVYADSQCKGKAQGACESDSSCTWVDGYKRQDGTSVDAYCRAKPGQGEPQKDKPARPEKDKKKDKPDDKDKKKKDKPGKEDKDKKKDKPDNKDKKKKDKPGKEDKDKKKPAKGDRDKKKKKDKDN